MMAFKLFPTGTLFYNKGLLQEPNRHVLIKKRQNKTTLVPSPIPITEIMVHDNAKYKDLIGKDAKSDTVSSSKEPLPYPFCFVT